VFRCCWERPKCKSLLQTARSNIRWPTCRPPCGSGAVPCCSLLTSQPARLSNKSMVILACVVCASPAAWERFPDPLGLQTLQLPRAYRMRALLFLTAATWPPPPRQGLPDLRSLQASIVCAPPPVGAVPSSSAPIVLLGHLPHLVLPLSVPCDTPVSAGACASAAPAVLSAPSPSPLGPSCLLPMCTCVHLQVHRCHCVAIVCPNVGSDFEDQVCMPDDPQVLGRGVSAVGLRGGSD
jgi:hypothetical protein